MARKPSQTFTDKELEIMRVIWEMGEASTKQIQERLPGEPHYNNVLTIVRVLERKGHLVHREEGRTFIYRAAESQVRSKQRVLRHLVRQVFGGSAASLVLNLVEAGDLSAEDLEEIRRQVKTSKKERGKKS